MITNVSNVKPSANVHSFGFDNANQLLCLNATALDIIPKKAVEKIFNLLSKTKEEKLKISSSNTKISFLNYTRIH